MSIEKTPLGFVSSDGFFQPISSLTVAGLEYVSHSKRQLEELLNEKLLLEEYEECALIRDELSKRKKV